jgi:Domain of unknown function (DUF5667)
MKKVAVIVAVVVAFSALGGTAYAAQDSLPGDALYPVKLGVERMTMMLRGGDVVRAERALNLADKRVREMQILIERERLGDLGVTSDKYCCAMNMSLVRMEAEFGRRGPHAGDIAELMIGATAQHLSTLNGLHDIVSDEAKPAIERAMVEAQYCYQRAIQVRQQLGLQVSGLASIPATIQERVEQWIQESAGA